VPWVHLRQVRAEGARTPFYLVKKRFTLWPKS
jgi:hypothetical protein